MANRQARFYLELPNMPADFDYKRNATKYFGLKNAKDSSDNTYVARFDRTTGEFTTEISNSFFHGMKDLTRTTGVCEKAGAPKF
jgi:hypothetical protein